MVRPRLLATKRVASELANVDANDNEATVKSPPESDYGPPVKKRRRTGVAAGKQKQKIRNSKYAGRGINQLCIDELYTVFAFIYPMDLLNLTRTCKYLRNFLMHKSSQPLWKDALSRVEGLPGCPADLTEPQYTNLVFYNHCHGCDKLATSILWNLRRRYCSACKAQWLCKTSTISRSIWGALPYDSVTMRKNSSGKYVDKGQLDSFMHEYNLATDKEQFLEEKEKLCITIQTHAYSCWRWQRDQGGAKRFDLKILRKERQTSIFERLRKHGYGPEIQCFGCTKLQDSYKSAFKEHTRLTDIEWEQMLPKWVNIMNDYRLERLDKTCYYPRRKLLMSEYNKYVRTSSTPAFDLLPDVASLDSFAPFRDIIEAPEEAGIRKKPFASAFAQLPVLIGEWKQQLDVELAKLVEIPPHLTLQDTSSRQVMESNDAGSDGSNLKYLVAKLHLACALFRCSTGEDLFTHREVFLNQMPYDQPYPLLRRFNQTSTSITQVERFSISFLAELPYIVHACGLDPNVATADDMDRRNARLKCLACLNSPNIVMDWRNAMLHASRFHARNRALKLLSESPRWQVISDDHIEVIQAVEASVEDRPTNSFWRCLLCRPRMRDGLALESVAYHMQVWHGLAMKNVEEDVHCERIGLEGYILLNKV